MLIIMQRKLRSTPRPQRGMALLEVLVSVLLFSLGVLGLIGLQARAMTFSIEAEDRNRAALLANEIASAMWLANTTAVDTSAAGATGAGTPSWNARVLAELPGGTVTVAPTGAVPNSAEVTIFWRPPQRGATESASSQLSTRVTLAPPP